MNEADRVYVMVECPDTEVHAQWLNLSSWNIHEESLPNNPAWVLDCVSQWVHMTYPNYINFDYTDTPPEATT